MSIKKSYFKDFSRFRQLSFKSIEPSDFNFLILNKKNIFLYFKLFKSILLYQLTLQEKGC